MSERPTEDLLRGLVRDLEPVKPIPRLRVVAGVTLLAWVAVVTVHWAFGGAMPRFGADGGWGDPVYGVVFVGIVLGAAGGLWGALASAVPGREREARLGLGLAATGAVAALLALLVSLLVDGATLRLPLAAGLSCGRRAVLLGLVPGIAACVFLARAFAQRPVVAAVLAWGGAVALGAAAVHASCVVGGPVHVTLGHVLGPLAAALLLAAPVAAVLRRRATA